jgi:hypothetical protein
LNFKQNSADMEFWADCRDRSIPERGEWFEENQPLDGEDLKKSTFRASVGFTRTENASTMVFHARAVGAERFGRGGSIGSTILCA